MMRRSRKGKQRNVNQAPTSSRANPMNAVLLSARSAGRRAVRRMGLGGENTSDPAEVGDGSDAENARHNGGDSGRRKRDTILRPGTADSTAAARSAPKKSRDADDGEEAKEESNEEEPSSVDELVLREGDNVVVSGITVEENILYRATIVEDDGGSSGYIVTYDGSTRPEKVRKDDIVGIIQKPRSEFCLGDMVWRYWAGEGWSEVMIVDVDEEEGKYLIRFDKDHVRTQFVQGRYLPCTDVTFFRHTWKPVNK